MPHFCDWLPKYYGIQLSTLLLKRSEGTNIFAGHNTSGEFIQTAGKVSYHCEKAPKMIVHYIEKNKDHITPVEGVDIRDVACGTNHTVNIKNYLKFLFLKLP